MNVFQLKYLKSLVQYGSFSVASENLQITQPALSLQIAKLEDEYGFKLVDRRNRPLKLTPEGEIFYEKAILILKLVDELKLVSYEMGEEVKGKIKMGIIPTLAPYLVPLFVNDLQEVFPNLQIEVSEMRTEEIIRQLKSGIIDCGIISTPVIAVGVIFERLFYEHFFAYISEKHPLFLKAEVKMEEILAEDIWYLEEGNCFQNQVNSICNISQNKNETNNLLYRSSSIESLRRIVENKGGITFIPELATVNIPPHLEEFVKPVVDLEPIREISLVSIHNNPKERQIAALKEIIINNIPKRMKEEPVGTVLNTKIRI